jgi:hypothetical protein
MEANKLISEENELKQQEANRAALKEEAAKMQIPTATRPSTSTAAPTATAPRPAANIPRTRTLTPDQIAAYVAKQTALASAQKAARNAQNQTPAQIVTPVSSASTSQPIPNQIKNG